MFFNCNYIKKKKKHDSTDLELPYSLDIDAPKFKT